MVPPPLPYKVMTTCTHTLLELPYIAAETVHTCSKERRREAGRAKGHTPLAYVALGGLTYLTRTLCPPPPSYVCTVALLCTTSTRRGEKRAPTLISCVLRCSGT